MRASILRAHEPQPFLWGVNESYLLSIRLVKRLAKRFVLRANMVNPMLDKTVLTWATEPSTFSPKRFTKRFAGTFGVETCTPQKLDEKR
jgi:hypothetical protein